MCSETHAAQMLAWHHVPAARIGGRRSCLCKRGVSLVSGLWLPKSVQVCPTRRECPTRASYKRVARVSHTRLCHQSAKQESALKERPTTRKSALQKCPTRVHHKRVPYKRVCHKSVPQECRTCPTRVFHKHVPHKALPPRVTSLEITGAS